MMVKELQKLRRILRQTTNTPEQVFIPLPGFVFTLLIIASVPVTDNFENRI